jgi:hypothetical protein
MPPEMSTNIFLEPRGRPPTLFTTSVKMKARSFLASTDLQFRLIQVSRGAAQF